MAYQNAIGRPEARQDVASTTADRRPANDISARTFWVLIVVVTLSAALVRFYHLGDKTLWIDEGGSWILTQLSWSEFVRAIRTCMAEMTLYYFLLRLWTVFGTSEFALRSFSVLLSVATVPLVALLGTRLYSRKAGILAAAVFSFHVWNINFAREARTYPLLTLLLVVGWLLTARIAKDPTSTRNWAWFGIVSVLAVYSHFLAVLTIAAQFATMLLVPLTWKQFKKLLATGVWIVVGCLPLIKYALRETAGNVGWAKPTTFSMAIPFSAPEYRAESAAGNVAYFLDFVSGWWSTPFVIYGFFVFAAVLAGCFVAVLIRKGRAVSTAAASVPVFGLMIPMLGLLAISAIHPAFVARYLMPAVVPLALGIGWLGQSLRKPLWGLALILVTLFLLKPFPEYLRRSPYQDFRGAAAYIGKHSQPGDVLYIWEPFARPALAYYGNRIPGFPQFLYPKPDDQFRPEKLGVDPWGVPPEMARYKRIWIVFNFEMPAEKAGLWPFFYQRAAEHTGHQVISSFHSNNMQALEFVRTQDTNPGNASPGSSPVSKVQAP
jgi:dolichyl-phosphate-mannose-protein mannosyltransferase